MAAVFNEFNIKRTAYASFTLVNSAASSTLISQAIIPKGAIVTGVRYVAPNAITVTGASGTVQLAIGTTSGSIAICATSNVSALASSAVPGILVMATTNGNYVTANQALALVVGASNNAAATATYDFYVDYIYTGSHD